MIFKTAKHSKMYILNQKQITKKLIQEWIKFRKIRIKYKRGKAEKIVGADNYRNFAKLYYKKGFF